MKASREGAVNYQIKLMVDYQCWPLWWSGDHNPGNIDPATLPLRAETVQQLEAWSAIFDATLNRDDPASSAFPSEAALNNFEQHGLELWKQLRAELEPTYTVAYYSLQRRQLLTDPDELNNQ